MRSQLMAGLGTAALVVGLAGPAVAGTIPPMDADINKGPAGVYTATADSPGSGAPAPAPAPAPGPAPAPAPGAPGPGPGSAAPVKVAALTPAQIAAGKISWSVCSTTAIAAGTGLADCSPDAAPAPAPAAGAPPRAQAKPRVTREQVGQRAVDQLRLGAPSIGSAPCTDEGCQGTVGVPVWLWVEDGDGGALPGDSASASAGPFSVTATAKVAQVRWDLGDGQSITCDTAGTKFEKGMPWGSSPDCGFPRGWQKRGTYDLTATYVWEVSWSGSISGSDTQEISSTETVTVGEYQGIVTENS